MTIRTILALTLLASAADAADTPMLKPDEEPANYALCLQTARAYPEQGLDLAKRWQTLKGGEPAQHCEAVALIGLHQYAQAAKELQALGIASKRDPSLRAGLLAQAAQAFTLDGDLDDAREAQTAALKLLQAGDPATVPILIDRAVTYGELKQYTEALGDLDAALAIKPKNAEALAFRASANRNLYHFADALKDAEAAVTVDPNNLTALLERGIAYRLSDQADAAKRDLEKVIALAPDSDAARAAKAHLARINVTLDAPPRDEGEKGK